MELLRFNRYLDLIKTNKKIKIQYHFYEVTTYNAWLYNSMK